MWRGAILLVACSSSATTPFVRSRPDLQYAPFDDDGGAEDLAHSPDLVSVSVKDLAGADLAGADLAAVATADLSVLADLATPLGDLSGQSSCKTLLAAAPGLASGSYSIQTASGQLNVICDMTTDGGGWTLVFRPLSTDPDSDTLDYQIPTSSSLWSGSSDVLLAFRDSSNGVLGDWARFAIPSDWTSKAPFQYDEGSATVSAVVTGAAAVSRTLQYGREDFDSACGDSWLGAGSRWGRICLVSTTAPFYDGFAADITDGCQTSSQSYGTTHCSSNRQFTIGIR